MVVELTKRNEEIQRIIRGLLTAVPVDDWAANCLRLEIEELRNEFDQNQVKIDHLVRTAERSDWYADIDLLREWQNELADDNWPVL